MTCRTDKIAQQDPYEAFEIIEITEEMESFKTMTLNRGVSGTLRSRRSITSTSVDSGLENEYTQIQTGLAEVHPSMWLKIKYPIEVDDASPNGMLSSSDFDAVIQNIQQDFSNWQIFLETKRTTNYVKYALPLTKSPATPKHTIIVKVKFSAWVTRIDTKLIENAVNDVLNKDGEFHVDIHSEKVKKSA